jgi:putative tricarboxylic transport membrane protein
VSRLERVTGMAIVLLGVGTALVARGFRVGFLTDPIGPRALPWLASALLGLGGVLMIVRPMPRARGAPTAARGRVILAVATFALYAIVLASLGFILATTLLMVLLARFFGGRIVPGLVAGLVFSASLWLLFAHVLGVPLPVGSLFLRGD